ncbi:MAG: biopolymer transporter ExbD [Limnobacter sp.]|nr:biopolymer transporter ExbD [Limnobacter sp.]
MRIPRETESTAPEINLIPLIDILLVIVIFLVVSSTFVRQSQLKINLPGSQTRTSKQDAPDPLRIAVGTDGNYAVNGGKILNEEGLRRVLTVEAAALPTNEAKAIIEADATATHQSVVSVMDILASLGIAQVSIATASQ